MENNEQHTNWTHCGEFTNATFSHQPVIWTVSMFSNVKIVDKPINQSEEYWLELGHS